MPGPVLKRRKLDRGQNSLNGVGAVPLASSGSTKASTGSTTEDFDKVVVKDGGNGDSEDDEFTLEESEKEPQLKEDRLPGANVAKRRLSAGQRTAQAQYLGGAYAGEIYKSNIFKLQVDELLNQVKPNFSRIESSIAGLLRTVKNIIEAIPDREPVSITDAQKSLRKDGKVAIPFIGPSPAVDPNYKLHYIKPTRINTIGSYPLKTITKSGKILTLDLTVAMPHSIFQEKDYLNHRYFYKRAYYLACIATGIKANKVQEFDMSYDYLNGNYLLPVLVIEPRSIKGSQDIPLSNFRITILPIIPRGLFPVEKLFPSKACVRTKSSTDNEATNHKQTPFYNASVMVDSVVTEYLKLQHDAAKESSSYQDACILGRVWLRQRGFSSRVEKGGFGNFEWAIMTALLLNGGGPKGMPVFSNRYSSYQLFKALLQYIASNNLLNSPGSIRDESQALPKKGDAPILFDSDRGLNILFKMTRWSYGLLQFEAHTTIAALNDSTFDHFDAAFILKVDDSVCKYDAIVKFSESLLVAGDDSAHSIPEKMQVRLEELFRVLYRALDSRAELIILQPSGSQPWPVDKATQGSFEGTMSIGIVLDVNNANRTVDHGPSAESKKEAADFRKFWGEVAELRRFKDGRILESIVWNPKRGTGSIVQHIVTYALSRHFGAELAAGASYVGDQVDKVLPSLGVVVQSDITPFQPVMSAFQQLERDIRGLEGLPLHLRQIQAADSQLSYSSVDIPYIPDRLKMSNPANVVIQFEGSARWPDDLDATQRTKFAFLLKLGEILEESIDSVSCNIGIENNAKALVNQAFLDVVYQSGAAFRLRIHHEREATLLERRVKDKSLSSQDKLDAALALSTYRQQFLHLPAHTQALQTLATRFPAFSSTVRLVKKWFSSHLLSHHFPQPLIELFVVRTFTNPYPWKAPCSATLGLLRTLIFLGRWDWHSEPWIVDFSIDGMKAAEVESISTRFEAWRKIDPALNRVVLFAASSIDGHGTTWTDYNRPAKVIASRMTALAQAAVGLLRQHGPDTEVRDLFCSSLVDYDVLIRLDAKLSKKAEGKRLRNASFKNLQLQGLPDAGAVGYRPGEDFMQELEETFGDGMMFFVDDSQADTIAALWNPQTRRPWKVKLGYSSAPLGKAKGVEDDDEQEIDINKDAILNEIARLGGRLVARIETV